MEFFRCKGNKQNDNDKWPTTANHEVDNVLSVGAMDGSGNRSVFKLRKWTVHVHAPGSDIMSTVPGNNYRSFSGTSMATILSVVLLDLFSLKIEQCSKELKEHIFQRGYYP